MRRLRIILIAHDGKKADLLEWARFNAGTLSRHELIVTAATGEAIREIPGFTVRTLLHGPAGGDAQAGALIATDASPPVGWRPSRALLLQRVVRRKPYRAGGCRRGAPA